MALSMILGEAGFTATRMDSKAVVTLDKVDDGFAVTKSHLTLSATIPNIDQAQFTELTDKAKAGCPISKLLKARAVVTIRRERKKVCTWPKSSHVRGATARSPPSAA